jgi:hypothetical protein
MRRLALVVVLVLLVSVSAIGIAESRCQDTHDLYCFAQCDYFWGYCVSGSSACVMLWIINTCETDPGSFQCCTIAARF